MKHSPKCEGIAQTEYTVTWLRAGGHDRLIHQLVACCLAQALACSAYSIAEVYGEEAREWEPAILTSCAIAVAPVEG
jgi:hypothetical protein